MSWFVAVVRRHGHQLVEQQLATLGYPAFYPRLRRWVSHARVRVAVERPLWPYMFVEIENGRFSPVLALNGVRQLLRLADDWPASVPDAIVYDWRLRYLQGEFDLTQQNIPVSALVRIAAGEFAEQLAIVTANVRGRVSVVPSGANRVQTMRQSNVSAVDGVDIKVNRVFDPRGRK